jgi:hypothetical protein
MAVLQSGLPGGWLAQGLIVAAAGGVGLVSFSMLASLLGLEEWRWLRHLLRARIGI